MATLAEQLRVEQQKLERGMPVSDCGLKAPRLNSSRDKKTNIAHEAAYSLFPLQHEKSLEVEKTHTYIQYQKLISKLTKAYKDQLRIQEEKERKEQYQYDRYRQARVYGGKEQFLALLNEPVQDPVLHPTPMPVDIAPLVELQPFFEHMKKNTVCKQECLEFKRGAYYDDGRIDMCKQVVGPTWISNLVESIRENPHVKHFLMGNNIADRKSAEEISQFIREKRPKIETWYLAGNCIDVEGARLLGEALAEDQYYKALWLKRNPLMAEGVKHIGKMLETNTSIEILDLVNVGCLDEGVKYLFESLKKNRTLKLLYLDANGITPKGAHYIAEYFDYLVENKLSGVTSLFMAINRLADEGTVRLAQSLQNYRTLERLDLASNRIQRPGLEVLLNAIKDHEQLIVLDVGLYKSTSDMKELPNYFDTSYDLLANFIRHNKYVQIMSIQDTNIGPEGLAQIADALEENDHMLFLYAGQYGYCTSKQFREKMWNKLEQNIHNSTGMDLETFRRDHLRLYKHTERVKDIDSIYRNNM